MIGSNNDGHDSDDSDEQIDEIEENIEVTLAENLPRQSDQYKIEQFPSEHAGSPIQLGTALIGSNNVYAPFHLQLDWEIARWAKIHGPSSAALTKLLQLEGVIQTLPLSYKNARKLNNIIDNKLPSRPSFKRFDIQLGGEETIIRFYHDMHTGNWWWEIQNTLEATKPGATLIPVIISSDKTQVTLFSGKTAYPVYLTIGNLPKAVQCKLSQRGQILLAYLPTSKLTGVTNRASQRHMVANLFHCCLRRLLSPLEHTGVEGTIMTDGDGIARCVHPILAVYIGDYPEQVMVTCVKTGECLKCNIVRGDIARDLNAVHRALSSVNGDTREYIRACKDAGIKPVYHPFWEPLPYIDIFQAITPDILHQLHQAWLLQAYGAPEIDARVRRLIPNNHIHIFPNGISRLFRVTGKEHNFISRIILGVVSDIRLPVRAVRALLDFIFLSQLPAISMQDLKYMESSLKSFHENKAIFVDLGICDNFTIPKLHALEHYITSIQLFGSTDNYNTQHTERLHIDYTKEAYRATNTRDEYPQMTAWLERQEKIERHEKYIQWQNRAPSLDDTLPLPPQIMPHSLTDRLHIKMTQKPTIQVVSLHDLVSKYGASFFCDAFARFVVLWRHPQTTRSRLEREAIDVHIPFRTISVYHRIRFESAHSQGEGFVDAILIRPQYKNMKGHLVPGRFDTALVYCGPETQNGIHGACMIQIRVVFTIGSEALKHLYGSCEHPPKHLAYVEWFTPFRPSPEADSLLYKIERSCQGNSRLASIIPVSHIAQSIHLSPLPSGRLIP
ncbi:hypothetical protein JOM56_015520 [Amanita muscaria]